MQGTKGRFITFEGGEGAGKSTQIRLLSDWLIAEDINPVLTREPGGAPGAEQIRELLVKGDGDRWTPMAEALLMTAARAEHLSRTILPALDRGDWVLCDRFYDSTVAYQGAARGLGMDRMRDLQRLALGDVAPDLTIILDIAVDRGLERAQMREHHKADKEDRFERLSYSFHENLRSAYLRIAELEPERCVIVNADRDIESLQGHIRDIVSARLGTRP